MMFGRWTSSTTSSRPAKSCAYGRSTPTRTRPAADPRFAYRDEDVVQTLERVCKRLGYPKTIRVDNGSEFISRDLDLWAYANNVTLDFSGPEIRPTMASSRRSTASSGASV